MCANRYMLNPGLETIHPNSNWKGVPMNGKGQFVNLHEPFVNNFGRLIKWQFSKNPYAGQKKVDQRELSSVYRNDLFDRTHDEIVWLGHASFLIRLNGVTLLTDPIFFDNFVLKNQVNLPFDPDTVRNIDAILVSHDHRDHCDQRTLSHLNEKCPQAALLTGLRMKPLISPWMPQARFQQAGWYQKFNMTEELEIIYVPSRHWGRRGLFDERKRLWGGFFIKSPKISIYFMGDSGYGSHFREIRQICGEPDIAIMGIGAYEPEWFMKSAHISPKDAVKAYRNLGAKTFIPMHYGSFDLSDEPLLMPLDEIIKLDPRGLCVLNPGEIMPL